MVKMVKIGTKVVMVCGAGIPEEYGVVTAIKNDGVSDYAVIEIANGIMVGDGFTTTTHDIKSKGETSINGSPIGVFVDV
jgi:hypothetical protein